jgi:hypothetical protein
LNEGEASSPDTVPEISRFPDICLAGRELRTGRFNRASPGGYPTPLSARFERSSQELQRLDSRTRQEAS